MKQTIIEETIKMVQNKEVDDDVMTEKLMVVLNDENVEQTQFESIYDELRTHRLAIFNQLWRELMSVGTHDC